MFYDTDTQTGQPDDPGRIVLRSWPSTSGHTYVTLGPEEVNFNYYSTWIGSDRIIVMSTSRARAIGVTLSDLGAEARSAVPK